MPQAHDDVRYESASTLATLLSAEGHAVNVKQVLQRAVEMSRSNPYWHCRLLFQLAVSEEGFASC